MNIETCVEKMRNVLGDEAISSTFRKLAQIEIEKCQRSQDRLKSELQPYENHFKMTSQNALKAYQDGNWATKGTLWSG